MNVPSVHEQAQFNLDQARRAVKVAGGHAGDKAKRAYWQSQAAHHRQEFQRLARIVRRLDEHRAAYGRANRGSV